jgi:hypothetical protein
MMPDRLTHLMQFNDFTSVTPTNTRYDGDHPPISTEPAGTQTDFYRTKLLKEETERLRALSAAAATALADVAGDLDADAAREAQAAVQEATAVLRTANFTAMPWIGISDTGLVTLQWQRDEEGVALFFSGDGVFGVSTKTGANDHYTDYRERQTADGLPTAIRSKIIRLSVTRASTFAP